MNTRRLVTILAVSAVGLGRLAAEPVAEPREKLVYQVRWGAMTAGEAVVEVCDVATETGPARHAVVTARTTGLLDHLLRVRARLESLFEPRTAATLRFVRQQDGRERHRQVEVTIDSGRNLARTTRSGRPRNPIPVPPGVTDPISAIFRLRGAVVSEPGSGYAIPVTDGRTTVTAVARVLRQERLQTPAGQYATCVIAPDLQGVPHRLGPGGEFEAYVWLSLDAARVPVRALLRTRFGTFTAELLSRQVGCAS